MQSYALKINSILSDILNNTKYSNLFNERHLHHKFSYEFQNITHPLFDDNCVLHPEWPTFKSGIIERGRYLKDGRLYKTKSDGGYPGFIDFAIGNYTAPSIGIEFYLKSQLVREEIIFDLMKLLDPKNSFQTCYCINIIYRKSTLNSDKHSTSMERRILKYYNEALKRLNALSLNQTNFLYFIIAEIPIKGSRIFWQLDRSSQNVFQQQDTLQILPSGQ